MYIRSKYDRNKHNDVTKYSQYTEVENRTRICSFLMLQNRFIARKFYTFIVVPFFPSEIRKTMSCFCYFPFLFNSLQ